MLSLKRSFFSTFKHYSFAQGISTNGVNIRIELGETEDGEATQRRRFSSARILFVFRAVSTDCAEGGAFWSLCLADCAIIAK